MSDITKHLSVLFLAGGLWAVQGCEPKTDVDALPEGQIDIGNPKQNFRMGVDILNIGKTSGQTDYEQAYTMFDGATQGDPGFAKAHYNAGYCAERLGRFSEAEGHYRSALANAEGYTEALLALASVLSSQEKSSEAIALYNEFLAANADNSEVRINLVDALIVSGDYDTAISESRQVLAREKDNVSAYNSLARVYFLRGEYAMSLLCSEKAKTLNEGDSGIYNAMGITYLKQGDEPAAIEQFKTAIKLSAKHRDANMNLGWVAVNSGDYALALKCFEAVTSEYPGDVDALLGLAVAQRGSKELDKSSDTYDKIIELEPDNESAYFNAATLHRSYTKNYKKALKYLQAFADAHQGQIGPSHEVYIEMDRVREYQEKEEEKKRIAEEKKRKAEEAKQRQMAQLTELKTRTEKLEKILNEFGTCEALIATGMAEMGVTVVEQAKMVIESNEYSMASDMMMFFDQVEPGINEVLPTCAAAAVAPAPEPEPEPAPAPEEGGEEAAAAEAAPVDAAPADVAAPADAAAPAADAAAAEEAAPAEEAPAEEPAPAEKE